ncbi:hypothetical protein TorRG33x02_009200 [Trema orientale]|uniref:Uncharacterized protein n=1 Tax=Trema orientale TaxID=63057 RepID=A0A2P5FYL4_TREOI|nr:hypothetical protein TorRG33x02_009200 [Trema orientale]
MGPAIIYSDVSRCKALTTFWPSLAQTKVSMNSLVIWLNILAFGFEKCYQIDLAIKDMKLRILRQLSIFISIPLESPTVMSETLPRFIHTCLVLLSVYIVRQKLCGLYHRCESCF